MDPISLIASIITLIGAGGSVAKGLRKLISLKEAPDSLLQLNNEISDLQLVASAIQEIFWQCSESLGEARKSHHAILDNALSNTKTVILELEVLIVYGLAKVTAGGSRVNRLAWVREERKIQAMKDRLRAARMDLVAATSLLNL